jgi:WXG100 family type VII secretion target
LGLLQEIEAPLAKAHVDPAELRRFAQDLNRFSGEIQSLVATMRGRMRGLEATWRDQEQRKFAEAFEHTVKVLAGFLDASQQHSQFLTKKAALIEEYLKQR